MAGARADIMAGRAYVSLFVRQDAFTRGMQQARRNLNQFGADMQAFGRQMVTMSAAALIPMAFATKAYADFDDAMRAVAAAASASEQDLSSMTKAVHDLAPTAGRSRLEIAKLMIELARANFSPDEINSMTASVLNLARATGTEAVRSAEVLSESISQFRLGATDATRVADSLTAAANMSFTTVDQLGESLSYAGPIAKDFGISLEDALAVLGGLGNAGVKASMAGTALRRILLITGSEATKLQGIFGVSFMDAAGNARPLVDTLTEVQKATAGMGTAMRAQKFEEAFGDLGITAASIIGKSGESIRKLADDIKAAGGMAEGTAKTLDSGLGGAIRRITAGIEGLAFAFAEVLQGPLQSVSNLGTGLLGAMTQIVQKNAEAVVSFTKWAVAIGVTGAAALSLGIAASVASVAIGGLLSVMGMLGTAAGLTLIPVKLLNVAIRATATVAAIARGAFMAMVGAVTVARTAFISLFLTTRLIRATIVATTAAVGLLRAAFVSVATGAFLATAATSAFSVVGAVVAALTSPLLLVGVAIAGIGYMAVQAAGGFSGIATAASAAMGSVGQTMGSIASRLGKLFGELKTTTLTAFGGIRDAIATGDLMGAANIAIAGLKLAFMQGMQAVSEIISGSLGETLATVTSQIIGGDFAAAWNTIVLGMANVWASFSGMIVTAFTSASSSILKKWKETIDSMTNYLLQQAGKGGVFGAFFEKISGVDVQAEMQRAERLRQQAAAAGMNTENESADQVASGTVSDPATQAAVDKANELLAALQDQADLNSAAAGGALAGANGGAAARSMEDVNRLKQELDMMAFAARMRREAANASPTDAAKAEGGNAGGTGAAGSGSAMGSQASAATFSAASLIAMSQGGGESPAIREQRQTRKVIERAEERRGIDAAMQIDAIKQMGLWHA